MNEAVFVFKFDFNEDAEIIKKSVYPEIKHRIPKTNVEIGFKNDKSLFLKIVTEDVSSLRASCNSYLRWIKTAFDVRNATH